MKTKTIILVLAMSLLSWLTAGAQSLESLTREQAREIVHMMTKQIKSQREAISNSVGDKFGTEISTMDMDVDGDSVMVISYVIPGYEGCNTREGRALAELGLAVGGRDMGTDATLMVCDLLDKAEYSIRAVYTDGKKNTVTLHITPARLRKLWTSPLREAGIDRELALKGLEEQVQKSTKMIPCPEGIKSHRFGINGNWLEYVMEYENPDFSAAARLPEFREVMNEAKGEIVDEFVQDSTMGMFIKILTGASDFLGVEGMKVKAVGSDGKEYTAFTVTWDELQSGN